MRSSVGHAWQRGRIQNAEWTGYVPSFSMLCRMVGKTSMSPKLHAGHMLLDLLDHDLLPQARKQSFSLCCRQSHAGWKDLSVPLDRPDLVFDRLPGTASNDSLNVHFIPRD